MIEIADLHAWLPQHGGPGVAVVSSLPDAAELGLELPAWREWYRNAAAACFAASDFVAIICTDRKSGGEWHSKPALVAEAATLPLTAHRIALRRGVGRVDLHRPTYSHILLYGGRPGPAAPDVVMGGALSWKNAVGTGTADAVGRWLGFQAARRVLNPCAGRGTLMAAALRYAPGRETLGCDIDPAFAGAVQGELVA